MKNLFLILILGSVCMVVSQGMEIMNGPSAPSTVFNMAALFAFSIGIWGVHRLQSMKQESPLSLAGAALLSIGALGLSMLGIQIIQALQAGAPLDFVTTPVYMIAAVSISLGTILFAISVIRINYYPKWTGLLLMAIPLINIATEVVLRTSEVRYYLNLLLAAVFIFMSTLSIRQLQPAH